MAETISITWSDDHLKNQAISFAKDFCLPLSKPELASDLVLSFDPEGLSLQDQQPKPLVLRLDFAEKPNLYRLKKATCKNEDLAKACGLKPNQTNLICDATAGLGRDSFLLAWLGAEVHAIEKHPVVYALLSDALSRAQKEAILAPITERIKTVLSHNIDWLQHTQTLYDVIYLDPMFAKNDLKAAVGKDMQLLRKLLQCEMPENEKDLLLLSRSKAKKRVVIKRGRKARLFADTEPHHSIIGRSSRFDVYLPEKPGLSV